MNHAGHNRPFPPLLHLIGCTLAFTLGWNTPASSQTAAQSTSPTSAQSLDQPTAEQQGWLWSASAAPRPAALAGIDADQTWQFRLATPGPLGRAPSDFRGWYRPLAAAAAPSVWLTDGSWLTGQLQEIDDQSVALQTQLLGRVTLPRSELQAMELQAPLGGPAERATRRAELGERPLPLAPPTLWLANGDRLPAELVRLTADHVDGSSRGETFRLDRPAVAGWRRAAVVDQRPAAATVGLIRLTLVDGSELGVRQITVLDDYRLALERPDGTQWQASSVSAPWWDELVSGIEPTDGWLRLSDVAGLNYRHQSLWGPNIPLRRRVNAAGGPLVVNGASFADGLGARSLSRLTLAVAPDWQAFQGLAGVDDAGGKTGSVVFRVLTYSDREGWRERWSTGVIRQGDPPRPIHVSLIGAERLALVVDPADNGDAGDLANWLMPRVVLSVEKTDQNPSAPPR